MAVEGDRQVVAGLPVDVEMLASLRESARLATTHYSTQIEGNRLTQAEVREVVTGARIAGRERDEVEVRNYYRALVVVEKLAAAKGERFIQVREIQRIYGLAFFGKDRASAYRDGQNVIRDSGTGKIVYMPPEAKDVPVLMRELVGWVNDERITGGLPVPLVAGLVHYQLATIHPYYDGNGRMARLVTTLILHRRGYGMKGIYSLEEYYAKDLGRYYAALTVGPSHNYYLGRADAEVTGFVAYFCAGMAAAFRAVRAQAEGAAKRGRGDRSAFLRELDPRERRLMALFVKERIVTAEEIAKHLGLSVRTVVGLCREWVKKGFLEMEDASRKGRSYRLGEKYASNLERR